MKACQRIVKPSGSICVNMGDKIDDGNLLLVPFRFALAVQDQISELQLINEVTWIKSNPTPRQDDTKLVSATEPFFIWGNKKQRTYFKVNEFQKIEETEKALRPKVGPRFGQKYQALIDASALTEGEKQAAYDALRLAVEDVKSQKISGIRMKIRGYHALAYGGQAGGRNTQILNQGFSIIRLAGDTMKVDHVRDYICQSVETIPHNKHPAVFPVELIEEFIQLLVPPGGVVLDPFMGSGTTAVAALNTGRKYVGIEISAEYKDLAEKRLEALRKSDDVFNFPQGETTNAD
jgi:site-specific DNA-methyltransferase (adenine-specific)